MAVGRAVRATPRPARSGERRAQPRPGRPSALRRGGAPPRAGSGGGHPGRRCSERLRWWPTTRHSRPCEPGWPDVRAATRRSPWPCSFPICSGPTATRATPSSWPSGSAGGASTPRCVTVRSGDPVPAGCQLYVVGGGEDLPQASGRPPAGAARCPVRWPEPSTMAPACWPCAPGSRSWASASWARTESSPTGWAWSTASPGAAPGRRAVGEIVVEPEPGLGLPALSGYENHAGVTSVGPEATAAGRVLRGIGNGDGSRNRRGVGRAGHRDLPARPGPGSQPGSGGPLLELGGRRPGAARRQRAAGPAGRAPGGRKRRSERGPRRLAGRSWWPAPGERRRPGSTGRGVGAWRGPAARNS